MIYKHFEIEPVRNYLFFIGSRDKPTREFKERINREIGEAMEGIKFTEEEHKEGATLYDTQVTHNPDLIIAGEPGIPLIRRGKRYLTFGILESRERDNYTFEELQEITEETAEKIENMIPEEADTKASFILLRDCSVNCSSAEGVTSWGTVGIGTGFRSRWAEEGGSSYDPYTEGRY